MPQFSKGLTFGAWILGEFLGEGGNAEVWLARRESGETAAVKILKNRNSQSEPYARFRQEVETVRRLGNKPGILPIIDSDLPDRPGKDRRAWLAMPVASPLSNALQGKGLRDVVEALVFLAETLASLKQEHAIHHRDLKPSNLYVWKGTPALSDFGLADVSEGRDLTPDGRPLGPTYFIPYEMLSEASQADPGPADVYSLAKTLWVLATDQRWPPQGEQRSDTTEYSVNEFRPHALAPQLDRLIERCTKHNPDDRPSMNDFARDLRAWLSLDDSTPAMPVDTAAIWKSIRNSAAPRLTEAQKQEDEERCLRAAVRRLQELLEPVHAEIKQNFAAAEFNARPKYVEAFLQDHLRREVEHEDVRAAIISGPDWNPIRLIIGVAVDIKSDGLVHCRGLYYLGRTEAMGGHIDEWKSDDRAATCGSIELDANLTALAGDLISAFPDWLQKLNDALSDRG